jgi:hypothetical protein
MMARDPIIDMSFKIQDIGDKSVEQARNALDDFTGAAREALKTLQVAGSVQSDKLELAQNIFSYVEQSVLTVLDFAQKVAHAKGIDDAAQYEVEFMSNQIASLREKISQYSLAPYPRKFKGVLNPMDVPSLPGVEQNPGRGDQKKDLSLNPYPRGLGPHPKDRGT